MIFCKRENYDGKNIFITGASSGIGEAVAREFAKRGANLILMARRKDLLEKIASELKADGKKVLCVEGDVTNPDDLARAVKETHAALGKVAVVFANAGFGVVGRFETLAIEDYRRQFETNVFGVLETLKVWLEDLKFTKGQMVVTGSVAGYIALPDASPYSMSKFTVRSLCQALWFELRPLGIGVTHLAPGFVHSEIRRVDNLGKLHSTAKEPLPSWLVVSTEKAARDIFRAISFRSREKVITGHGKILVWFVRHFPALLYRAMALFALRSRKQPN